jgi:hypothetical protein
MEKCGANHVAPVSYNSDGTAVISIRNFFCST